MRPILRQGIVLLVSGAIFCSGCTKTRVATVGRLDEPIGETAKKVQHSGIYTAKWTESDRKNLRTIPNSSRMAFAGDRLGFQRFGNGQLIGVHRDARFPLAGAPPTAKYVVWQHRDQIQTQFGKEMTELGEGTVETLKVIGIGALVVSGVALMLYLDLRDTDCDESSFGESNCSHKHHKHRKK